jgi:hypothetical protein
VSDVLPLRNLPAGAYTLRATLTDGAHSAARAVGFVVR